MNFLLLFSGILIVVILFWRWYNHFDPSSDLELMALETMKSEAEYQTQKALNDLNDDKRRLREI